jgi:hypothetical protein
MRAKVRQNRDKRGQLEVFADLEAGFALRRFPRWVDSVTRVPKSSRYPPFGGDMACLVSKAYLGCGKIWSWPFEAYLLADTNQTKAVEPATWVTAMPLR